MYRLYLYPYRRPFRRSLHTHHGIWREREGIVLALQDEDGRVGWGEIAPLPEFGSETGDRAWAWCQQFGGALDEAAIAEIPDEFPACQFAFESALANLYAPPLTDPERSQHPRAQLLPTGAAALSALREDEGASLVSPVTYKWKIGVTDGDRERSWFAELLELLRGCSGRSRSVREPKSQLRLDANGGLSEDEARRWLAACEGQPVEFLEQPLGDDPAALLRLQEEFSTLLALDESVASVAQLERWIARGWRGVFVVKAAIVGSPRKLRQVCGRFRPDTVFSSVFETAIARHAALQLAEELQCKPRALGFGVSDWFAESDAVFLTRLLRDAPFPENQKPGNQKPGF